VDEPRNTALKEISAALDRIAIAIKKAIVGTRVQETRAQNPDRITRLTVAVGPTRIKIEPNEVIRGSVFPAQERELTRRAEDTFELSVTAQTLSPADLYGGNFALRWTVNIHGICSMSSFSWITEGITVRLERLLSCIWQVMIGRSTNYSPRHVKRFAASMKMSFLAWRLTRSHTMI
jgi:hypothetical protein